MEDFVSKSAKASDFETMGNVGSKGAAKAAAPSKNTKLMKKTGNAKGGTDPYKQAKPARPNKLRERSGARYGISVKMPKGTSPEAGLTQSNGRIIPSSINRSRPNFNAGMTE
jgi:hypothetical protein